MTNSPRVGVNDTQRLVVWRVLTPLSLPTWLFFRLLASRIKGCYFEKRTRTIIQGSTIAKL